MHWYADQHGGRRFHLDTLPFNADMLIALEHVFGQATFGDDRVGFEPVLAGKDGSLAWQRTASMQIRSIEPPLDAMAQSMQEPHVTGCSQTLSLRW